MRGKTFQGALIVIAALALACLGCSGSARSAVSAESDDPCFGPASVGGKVARECAHLIVFLEPSASAADIEAVGESLRADGQVLSIRFMDQVEALSEFSSLFASDPSVTKNIKSGDLPPSYRVMLKAATNREAEQAKYKAMHGVQEVVVGPSA